MPGLWDIDFTGNKLADEDVLKLMQDLDMPARLALAEKVLYSEVCEEPVRGHRVCCMLAAIPDGLESKSICWCWQELKKARYMLRQHQRLRDIVQKRDQAPRGFH